MIARRTIWQSAVSYQGQTGPIAEPPSGYRESDALDGAWYPYAVVTVRESHNRGPDTDCIVTSWRRMVVAND